MRAPRWAGGPRHNHGVRLWATRKRRQSKIVGCGIAADMQLLVHCGVTSWSAGMPIPEPKG
jgi:hypothetical protein